MTSSSSEGDVNKVWKPASQWGQFKALMYKNYLLKLRNWKSTIGEALFPLYLCAFLAMLGAIIPRDYRIVPAIPYPLGEPLPPVGPIAPLFAYSPNDNELVNEIMSLVARDALWTELGNLTSFATMDELLSEQEARAKSLTPFYAAVSFNPDHEDWPNTIEYTLMYDELLTDNLVSSVLNRTDALFFEEKWILNGVASMQAALNAAIAKHSLFASGGAPSGNVSSVTGGSVAVPLDVAVVTMVSQLPSKTSEQVLIVYYALYPYFMIAIFFNSYQAISAQLGSEKERKVRETLRIAGLKTLPFWASWFVTQFIMTVLASFFATGAFFVFQIMNHSSFFLVFFINLIFGVSLTTGAFLISIFIRKAKTMFLLGAFFMLISTGLYYLCGLLLFRKDYFVLPLRRLVMLLSPIALGHAMMSVGRFEAREEGLHLSNINSPVSEPAVSTAMYMMIIDTFLYLSISLYLEQVRAGEYGISRPWNFLCQRSFWNSASVERREPRFDKHPVTGEMMEIGVEIEGFVKAYKKIPPTCCGSLAIPDTDALVHDLQGLDHEDATTDWESAHDKYKVVVRDLSLKMYKRSIFALLGHNGAGKSTTQSMLVGMVEPTFGDAYISGYSVRTQLELIRERLGVCPQFDVIYDDLTALEHMILYAGLRGIDSSHVEERGRELLIELGLESKMNSMVGTFSGGQKRRLSVGLALLGDSEVIFLDEPTTGMDPFNRRKVWELLQKAKQTKTIILTTHSMEEADLLGDTIAIMSHGRISAMGDSAALKERYGIGYHLHISVEKGYSEKALAAVIASHVEHSKLLTQIGSEVSYALPLEAIKSFPILLEDLDQRKKELRIASYAVSLTTLEEVFLQLAKEEEEKHALDSNHAEAT